MPEIGSTWVAVAPSAKGFGGKLNSQVQSETKSANVGGRLAKTLGDSAKVAFAAVGTAVVAGITSVVTSGVRLNKTLADYNARFITLTGSAEGAGKAMAAMESVKLVSGQQKGDLLGFTQTLLGAGVSAEQVEDRLRRLTKAGFDNTEQVGNLTRMYAQVRTGAGMTQAQMQMLARGGFDPLAIVMEKTGRSAEDLSREFSGAQGNGELFLKALEMSTDAGGKFAGVLDDMQDTVGGSARNMQNAWQNFTQHFTGSFDGPLMGGIASFNNAIAGSLKNVIDMTKESEGLTRLWETVASALTAAGQAIGSAIESIASRFYSFLDGVRFDGVTSGLSNLTGLLVPLGGILAGGLGRMGGMLGPLAPMFKKLTGPVGIVISLFIKMWRESDSLRAAVGQLFTTLSGVMTSLQPVMDATSGLITMLAGTLGNLLGDVLRTVVIPLIEQLTQNVFPVLILILTSVMGQVAELAAMFGERLGQILETVVMPLLMMLMDQVLVPLMPIIEQVAGVVVELAGMLGDALFSAIETLLPPLMDLVAQVLPILMGVIEQIIPLVLELAQGVLSQLIDVFLGVVESIAPLIPVLGNLIGSLLPPLLDLFMALANAIFPIIDAMLPLIGIALEPLMDILVAIITPIAEAIAECEMFGNMVDSLTPVIEFFGSVIETVFGVVVEIVGGAMDIIQGTIGTVMSVVQGDWSGAWEGISGAASNVWGRITGRNRQAADQVAADCDRALGTTRQAFTSSWRDCENTTTSALASITSRARSGMASVTSSVSTDMTATSNAVRTGFSGATNATNTAMSGMGTTTNTAMSGMARQVNTSMTECVNSVRTSMTQAQSAVTSGFTSMNSAATSGVNSVVSTVGTMPGRITSAIGNTSNLLFSRGQDVVNGLINGINSRLGALNAAVGSVQRAAASARAAQAVTPTGYGSEIGIEPFTGDTLADTMANVAATAGSLTMNTTSGLLDGFEYAPVNDTSRGGLTRAEMDYLAERIGVVVAHRTTLTAAQAVAASYRARATDRPPLHGG